MGCDYGDMGFVSLYMCFMDDGNRLWTVCRYKNDLVKSKYLNSFMLALTKIKILCSFIHCEMIPRLFMVSLI